MNMNRKNKSQNSLNKPIVEGEVRATNQQGDQSNPGNHASIALHKGKYFI